MAHIHPPRRHLHPTPGGQHRRGTDESRRDDRPADGGLPDSRGHHERRELPVHPPRGDVKHETLSRPRRTDGLPDGSDRENPAGHHDNLQRGGGRVRHQGAHPRGAEGPAGGLHRHPGELRERALYRPRERDSSRGNREPPGAGLHEPDQDKIPGLR